MKLYGNAFSIALSSGNQDVTTNLQGFSTANTSLKGNGNFERAAAFGQEGWNSGAMVTATKPEVKTKVVDENAPATATVGEVAAPKVVKTREEIEEEKRQVCVDVTSLALSLLSITIS